MEALLQSWDLSELYSTFCGKLISHQERINLKDESQPNTCWQLMPVTSDCSKISDKFSDIDIDSLPVDFVNTNVFDKVITENNIRLPQKKKKKKESKFCYFNLKELLSEHPVGKELLLISNQKKIQLEASWISTLCEIIVYDCLKKNITLVNEDHEELASKIVELFPAECTQTFYVPPVKKKDSLSNMSLISKGKLVDKYRNTLVIIRNIKKFSECFNNTGESESISLNTGDNSALESKQWLMHHREELDVLLHWKSSFELRRSEVDSNKYSSVTDIFNDWPILKESICSVLINTDYDNVYKNKVINVNESWGNIFHLLKNISVDKIAKDYLPKLRLLDMSEKNVSPLSKYIIQLEIFIHLLSAVKPRRKGKNSKKETHTRNNNQEDALSAAIESVYMHVKVPGDVDTACEKKICQKAKTKSTIQPFLIVVGPNELDLQKVYVQVDNFRFETSTFIEGFDLLFKFYLMFKIAYPVESQNFCKFYSNTTVTEKLAQETIQEFQKLMSEISVTTLKKLKERIPIEYHDFMEDCFKLDVFENFDSKWRCMQQLKNSEFYFAPRQFKIGEIGDDKNINNSIKWTKKACYGQIISLRAVLKKFLELPNVFKTIMNFMQTESARIESQGDIYSSLFQGTLWKNISGAFQEKIVIPLYLYYDDFEIDNPLSTSAGIYKVGGLYCSIAALPPQFASTTANVFLPQLIHNSDYKEFGAERCFAEIKDELNYLTQFGITISINGESHRIYFVLIGILGDNLG
ncbi:Protein of unknown function [Cotesia congregata]|uniref:Uncharacterized protein n=1 Tax=Cotesia congregata TaxID=51543 RepID=A0A8J2MDS1_COTCN|nr:Protein of unknown function [Cotesia congregata]